MTSLVDFLKSKPGVAGGVGRRAVSAALAAGYSQSAIEAAGRTIKADTSYTGPTSGFDTAVSKIGTADSGWFGDAGDTSAIQAMEAGSEKDLAIQAYHDKQAQHVGGADTASMRIGGQSWTGIQDYIGQETNQNPNYTATGSSKYSGVLSDIETGAGIEANKATNTANSQALGTLQTDYDTLLGNYKGLQGNYTTLQADVAQAAKDALKIKYTGSTAVQNPSAMGIQTAQGTPFKGSGLAGTAALARPNKGLKIKTLNV